METEVKINGLGTTTEESGSEAKTEGIHICFISFKTGTVPATPVFIDYKNMRVMFLSEATKRFKNNTNYLVTVSVAEIKE